MREQLVKHKDKIFSGVNKCLYITAHETANTKPGANAQAHANLQSNGGARQASWHVQVDDTEAIRSYPDTAQCWHGGTAEANKSSLAVEICVNSDGDYDAAFKRAAGVVRGWRIKHKLGRDKVVQHFEWTGKNCPAKMRLADRWEEFLDLTEPIQTISKDVQPVGMINPVSGRVSSEYSPNRKHPVTGRNLPHLGIDIAAPTGTKVVAAFAGTVTGVRTGSYNGDQRSGLIAGRTGNGVMITNPDGESQYYGHLSKVSVRKGDKVKAGQKVGEVGATGVVTGPHLHLEIHGANGGTRNPRVDFKHFGVTPGKGGAADVKPVGNVKPAPAKPAPKPATVKANSGNSKADNKAIAELLNHLGYKAGNPDGVPGPYLQAGVKAFQLAANKWGGAKFTGDGDWGPLTQRWFEWVRDELQRNVGLWQASQDIGKLRRDGDYAKLTNQHVAALQRNNRKLYKGEVDGKAQAMTCKAFDIKPFAW